MNNYYTGNMVRVQATFVDSAGTQVDPTSIYVYHRVTKPAPTDVTTLGYGPNSIVRLAAGVYYTDLEVNSPGEWRYRFRGYGANAAAREDGFLVMIPVVGP